MKLKIVVPHLETNLTRAVVGRWNVSVGDTCQYGQPICDLTVTERVRTKGVGRADALIRLARRDRAGADEHETERGRFVVTYRVVASEPATILEVHAAVGDQVAVGDTLAMAESPHGDQEGAIGSTAPSMRVVAVLAAGDEGE